jgi:hypothetical protein
MPQYSFCSSKIDVTAALLLSLLLLLEVGQVATWLLGWMIERWSRDQRDGQGIIARGSDNAECCIQTSDFIQTKSQTKSAKVRQNEAKSDKMRQSQTNEAKVRHTEAKSEEATKVRQNQNMTFCSELFLAEN